MSLPPTDVIQCSAKCYSQSQAVNADEGPATVSELSEPFPMALPNFLKHMRILEQSGLIETRKHGRVRVCAIQPDALSPTEQWLSAQRKQMSGTLDRMAAYGNSLKAQ